MGAPIEFDDYAFLLVRHVPAVPAPIDGNFPLPDRVVEIDLTDPA
jgi:hypothetical protein